MVSTWSFNPLTNLLRTSWDITVTPTPTCMANKAGGDTSQTPLGSLVANQIEIPEV